MTKTIQIRITAAILMMEETSPSNTKRNRNLCLDCLAKEITNNLRYSYRHNAEAIPLKECEKCGAMTINQAKEALNIPYDLMNEYRKKGDNLKSDFADVDYEILIDDHANRVLEEMFYNG